MNLEKFEIVIGNESTWYFTNPSGSTASPAGGRKKIPGDLKALNEELQTRFKDLAAENQKHKEQIKILMTRSTNQEQEIHLLKKEHYIDDITKPKPSEMSDTQTEFTDDADSLLPRLPPSSCRQLSTIGHYLDGIYLVANPDIPIRSKLSTVTLEAVHVIYIV